MKIYLYWLIYLLKVFFSAAEGGSESAEETPKTAYFMFEKRCDGELVSGALSIILRSFKV